MTTVVFLGPSLPAAKVPAGVRVLPPARQGDVLRAVRELGAITIGIVDGVFRHDPPVWHKEILWALDRGVRVLGAASMGALRAAECAAFGMEPVGRIATAYLAGRFDPFDGAFEDDDEVAVVHAPASAGHVALSDALVDLRATLAAAEAEGVLDAAARDALAAEMKRLFFPDRSFARLAEAAEAMGAASFRTWLTTGRVALKRQDAAMLLDRLAAPAPHRPAFRFARSLAWERAAAASPPLAADDAAVLAELGLDPAAWRATARTAAGLNETTGPAPLDAFRRRRALWTRAALEGFLRDNGTDAAGLARLLRQEAALDAVLADPPPGLHAAMADVLRLEGRYAPLSARARAKQGLRARPGGPEDDAALVWYFEDRLGVSVPALLGQHAALHGFADADAFVGAVRIEALFVAAEETA